MNAERHTVKNTPLPTSIDHPHCGLHLATTPRLRALLRESYGYRDRLDAERGIWPAPFLARQHVDGLIDEAETELVEREIAATAGAA